jgi:mRNA interferase HicA
LKKRDLEKRLKELGWWLLREGGSHEVWTNGSATEFVPRHNEIKEILAKKILKNAATTGTKS